MKITESKLIEIIGNAVANALNEYMLKNRVREMVRESLEAYGGFSQFEAEDNDTEQAEAKPVHNPDGISDMNNETKEQQELRNEVEAYFKKDGIDIAPFAYKLYGVEKVEGEDTNEMKNARSKFMKCLNHEPNTNGYPYSFTSHEINRLKSLYSAGQMSEAIERAVNNAIKKVLG